MNSFSFAIHHSLFVILHSVLFFLPAPSFAQDIERTYDGGWSFGTDQGFGIAPTVDGGFIITGAVRKQYSLDLWLIKIDKYGCNSWEKTFGNAYTQGGYSVCQTADKGYIVSGVNETGNSYNPYDTYVVKTDSAGNLSWSKTHGGYSSDEGFSIRQIYDGGYIMVGETYTSYNSYDVYLVRMNSSGDTLWTKSIGGSDNEAGYSVVQAQDSGFVIAGHTKSFGAGEKDVYLLKTDILGNILWTKTFGGISDDQGKSIYPTTDNGFILAGSTRSFGNDGLSDIYLIKTNEFGDSLWARVIDGGNNFSFYANSILQTQDGGYTMAGSRYDNAGDVFIMKTDSNGDSLWYKQFGGNENDEGNSLCLSEEGSYGITGTTQSYGFGSSDAYFIKVFEPQCNSYNIITINDTIPFIVYDTIFTYDTVIVYDTIITNIYDTVQVTIYDSVAVTDTLIIDVLLNYSPPDNVNSIKIYPNPTKTHIFINVGNYILMNNYKISIKNSAMQQVFYSIINQPSFTLDLSGWGGTGVFFFQILDSSNNVIHTRKIILY